MSTTIVAKNVPESVVLDDGNHRDEATLVGTSMRGWIYRSSIPNAWYRLIPIEDSSLEWRHSIQADAPSDGCVVSASRDWHQPFPDGPRLVVWYQGSKSERSLADCLRDNDIASRLRCAIATIRMLARCWQTLSPPIMPMPSDVVVNEDGVARLLWLPKSPLPNDKTVFDDPQRLLYLSPEILRSATNVAWDVKTWEAADRFAIGTMLLSCYAQLPCVDQVETTLFRAATATLIQDLRVNQELPAWLERFSTHRRTLALLHRLASPTPAVRLNVDLEELQQRLERCVELSDPRKAVDWLRDRGKPQDALDLLQEILPLTESLGLNVHQRYELLCQAGELCGGYLRRPLDALDYYERAIALQGDNRKAYQEQLRLIAAARHHASLETTILTGLDIAVDLDVKLWRNYRTLYGERTTHSDDADEEMEDRLVARYVLWRGQYDIARDFIYPRLSDASGTYVWWDFDLNLAYVQSFLGLENGDGTNLDRAAEQVQLIKNGFEFVRQNGSLDLDSLGQYGQELSDIEIRIFQLRSGTDKAK